MSDTTPGGHEYQGNGTSGCDALLAGKVRCGAGLAQHPEETSNRPTLPTPEQVRNLSAAEAAALAKDMNYGREVRPAGLTDAEKLAALETYIKALEPMAKALRARVTEDMGVRRVERVGAYLGDVRLATVGYSAGRKTAKVIDSAAALKWCIDKYPDEIVKAINPAFLKALLDVARVDDLGDPGVDPRTGEILDFIEVTQGSPYVTLTTTPEGVSRMEALALGFARTLEASPAVQD